MATNRETRWLDAWYGQRKWSYWLLPLMWLFRMLASARRYCLTHFAQQTLAVPVIVVGNISVGGTGKTPLLIALVKHLQTRGFNPGIISRGYGGQAPHYPFLLTPVATVAETGDEPLGIFQQTGCPVCVGADRVASGKLLQQQGCNILLSDDGLQHYRLGRTLELAVVDGERGFGNGYCLPVGPLREPVKRLFDVDLIVINGKTNITIPGTIESSFSMKIVPIHWARVTDQQIFPLDHLAPSTQIHAVAGIGNPQRFYKTLRTLQLNPLEHDFPDHHAYDAQDFAFAEPLPVVMTTKDAVKCQPFAQDNWYSLVIHAQLPDAFWQEFDTRVRACVPAPVTKLVN